MSSSGANASLNLGTPTDNSRTFGTSFQPSATRHVLVSYTVAVEVGSGEDAEVQLLSDAADPPTTVRATVRNKLAGAVGASSLVEGQLVYLVPAGHYVKVASVDTAGTGNFTLADQVETEL